ncbi:FecR family protein [Halalkalibaculum sp. DA384]|uniref:FecR family protein n=1 Tax=Halalkalibaculum sp. DA384 TaxID=3373606 RepID=UPI0037545B0F
MNDNIPWELLARYFAGELDSEEKRSMESWINEEPKREKKVEELREVWEQSRIPGYQVDPENAWKRLVKDMDRLDRGSEQVGQILREQKLPQAPTQHTHSHSHKVVRRLVMVAAAAAVMLAAGLFTYSNYNELTSQDSESAEIAKREIVAQNGERATYILSDGSRVVLHAGSRMEVPLSFNSGERELFLEGEAYFEVTHDESKPFTVHSESAFTRVLGTKFLLKAWPDERNEVEVVVSEGKVALGREPAEEGAGSKQAIVTKNKIGRVSSESDPEVLSGVDMNWYMGWTEGKLIFKDRPLSQIIPKLERWYAIEIRTENDAIARKRLTAEIDYSQSMSEVLKGIALSLDLKVQKKERTVIFQAQHESDQE